jgi:hypothetical protein
MTSIMAEFYVPSESRQLCQDENRVDTLKRSKRKEEWGLTL